jgi:hypothetical protein
MTAEARAYPKAAGDAALEEYMRWYCGLLLSPNLNQDEGD